ncbi:hypothetical protein [Streptomyces sp. NPDC088727]|uniref:hypothetical protein n=1 Tax=Streptomyces sp. NPDC088727 TaxID=3365875 RepID=UPI003810DC0B
MARFLLGICLAAVAFGTTKALSESVELSVFVAAVIAIGVWFRGFELIIDVLCDGIASLVP